MACVSLLSLSLSVELVQYSMNCSLPVLKGKYDIAWLRVSSRSKLALIYLGLSLSLSRKVIQIWIRSRVRPDFSGANLLINT